MATRSLKRMRFRDKPISMDPREREHQHERTPQCGCAMCRLRRAQLDASNHSLSAGVFDPEFRSPATDSSPRASLSRAQPNVYEEINRRNEEFWKQRGGIPA